MSAGATRVAVATGLILSACGAPAALEGVVGEEGIRAPTPIALVAQQDLVRRRQPIVQDGGYGLEKDALVLALSVAAGAPAEPGLGDRKGLARELEHRRAAEGRAQRRPRHLITQPLALLRAPVLDEIPGGVERGGVVEQPGPQRRYGANAAPAPTIGPAHFQKALHAHLGEQGGEVVRPIVLRGKFARQLRQPARQEIAK